ncbi:flagellar hook-length control protein FliK [Halomonas vilamensis]|uniref:Flagellar hook-length control protein FliK n=1 Tax=Vreelandella vilamensis TaxID=531309 RepID=A0ABU1H360_9GAMM|nr:flagellar hook-length control protein FliK [Halomonas vilamensis]MDR5898729.1 flagellar hook-length control protein FliK [Halomonas vilamensis]
MSGITPLIDTLMHQVLGKRGDSSPRVLNEPVRPVDSGEGPRAVHSDSRLDARASDPRLTDLRRLPPQLDMPRQGVRGELPPQGPGSTQTHFSPAARSIADVLLRFPAPPSVLRPEAPLMSTAETSSPQSVATRLEASIRDSGLFYESHLKRWFQGEGSRQQLLREPQMQPGVRPTSSLANLPLGNASGSAAGTGSSGWGAINNSLSPNGAPLLLPSPVPFVVPERSNLNLMLQGLLGGQLGQGGSSSPGGNAFIQPGSVLLPVTGNAEGAAGRGINLPGGAPLNGTPDAARGELAGAREMLEMGVARQSRDVVNEGLQSLVRQQLEMLVMPTIRWEGDVWAGIFMALVVNLPGREEEKSGEEKGNEEADSWRSEMRLEVPNLGELEVALSFYRGVLNVDLTTASEAVYQRLEEGVPALEKRLSALDLRKVQVHARHITPEDANELSG